MSQINLTTASDEQIEVLSGQSRDAMNERMRRNAPNCPDKLFLIGAEVRVHPQIGDPWRGFIFSNEGGGEKIGVFHDAPDGTIAEHAWVGRHQLVPTGGYASF